MNMQLIEPVVIAFLFCALINLPMILQAKRLRKLSAAKLQIITAVTEFETKLLDGSLKNGDACHDVLFASMTRVQNREIYRVRWNPLRPSNAEIKFHEMLRKELDSKDEAATILRRFCDSYSKAYRTKYPIRAICFALWVSFWGSGFKLFALGLIGLLLSLVGIQKMVKSYRAFRTNLDTWLLAKTLSPA